MLDCFASSAIFSAIPIKLVKLSDYSVWLQTQTKFVQQWLLSTKFQAKVGDYALIPANDGTLEQVVIWFNEQSEQLTLLADVAQRLPAHDYVLENATLLHKLGWAMGAYHFSQYKKFTKALPKLLLSDNDLEVLALAEATYLVRDLINTPAEDMGPAQLAAIAEKLAQQYQADFSQVVGDALLTHNFPAIHAVGRASVNAPRLIELIWGDYQYPHITLVGKGVCFDTGGLDLKGASNMRLMRKDMGGAAHVLALAKIIMQLNIPVYLTVLISAVENSVAGNAMRPGDIITMRNGKTVEIDNTDAEGRLVLADALTYACEKQANFIIDFATLTGAARTAVGTEMAAYFSNNESLAQQLECTSKKMEDPVWRLPLYAPYLKKLDTPFADIKNSGDSYAGASTAALFMQCFINNNTPWLHFDIMAWNSSNRRAHPEGGEAMALRATYELINELARGKKV
jgi:leucyl aminopeptidase